MNRIIKLSSTQSEFNTTNKNLVDFTIPRDEVYNLQNSHILVNISISSTDTNETPSAGNIPNSGGRGVQCLDLELELENSGTSSFHNPNVCLVKNAYLSGANVGKIEDLRDLESLKVMTYGYEKDFMDTKDATHYGLSGHPRRAGFRLSPFRDLKSEGTNLSKELNHDVKIGLSEIFNSCDNPLFDTGRLGDVKVHLEMNFDKLQVVQSLDNDDTYWTDSPTLPSGVVNGACNDTATAGAGGISVTTLNPSRNYGDSSYGIPYWVGQKIAITGDIGGTPLPAPRERIITGIQNNDGDLTLTLDSELVGLSSGNKLDNIRIKGVDVNTTEITINSCELVLDVVENPSNVPSSYTYYTYSLESDQPNQQKNFSKVYQLEPNCINVYVNTNGKGIPQLPNLTSWRYRLDNKEQVNRPIEHKSALNRDHIRKVYLNNGRTLKNISNELIEMAQEPMTEQEPYDAVLFPVINKPEPSLLGLDINCSAGGVQSLGIYKELVKTI